MSRAVIVGAGIAGLSVAHAIRREAPDIELVLLEATGHVGGNIRSDVVNGYLCESGPDGFLDSAPATLALVREIGLSDRLLRSTDVSRRRFLFHRGKLHALPTSLRAFATTRLLSPAGKLRVALEPFARGQAEGDESIYDFAARRIGREAAHVMINPMVSGIFAGDARALSLRACFPKLWQMETQCGGLIRGLLTKRQERPRNTAAIGVPAATLTSFTGGMEDLVRALVASLSGCVRTNTPATVLRERCERSCAPRQLAHGFTITAGGRPIEADAVVLAGGASDSADLVRPLDPALASVMSAIRTAPVAVVCLGYDDTSLTADRGALNGFGFLVPQGSSTSPRSPEAPRILGGSWETSIYSGRAPAGKALLRVMLGGATDPDTVDLDDAELVSLVRADLSRTMRLTIQPEFIHVIRHRRGIPQYTLGHLHRLERLDTILERHPGLFVAGSSYHGVSINSCIEAAPVVAARVIDSLRTATTAAVLT